MASLPWRPAGRRTGKTEDPAISRHLAARLLGIAVLVVVFGIGLGAGGRAPGIASTVVPTPTPVEPSVPAIQPAGSAATPAGPGSDRYLAPGGSDAAAGTVDAPWATLVAASTRLRPGDTLWVRQGRYASAEVDWSTSGTAAAPITVRGYPGERATFDGAGSDDKFLWFRGGAGWIVLRDIVITGYRAVLTGVISLTDGAHDLVFDDLEMHGTPTGSTQDHLIYLSAPGVHDVTIEASVLVGASGAAIHVYHQPAATSIRVLDNRIENSHFGVLLYSGTSDVLVSGNQFLGGDVAVKLEVATGVILSGNTATSTDGIVIVGPPIQAQYTDQGNQWPRPPQMQAP